MTAATMHWPKGMAQFNLDVTRGELARNARFTNAEAVLVVEAYVNGVSPRSLAKIWNVNKTTIWSVINGVTYRDSTHEARAKIVPPSEAKPMKTCPWCGHTVYTGREKRNNPPVSGRCGQTGCRMRIRLVGDVYVKGTK